MQLGMTNYLLGNIMKKIILILAILAISGSNSFAAQQIINNKDSGLLSRTKINDNFTDSYTDVSTYHNGTDPATDAATNVASIDDGAGVVITLTTTGNSQTLASPTDTTRGKKYTVANASSSTDYVPANGINVLPGEAVQFLWDGAAWGLASPEHMRISSLRTVSPDGTGDYTTIQAAITASSASDIVKVYSGTYNENLIFKDDVAVIGEALDTVYVQG